MANLASFIKLSALLEAFQTPNKVPTKQQRKTPVIGAMRPKNLGTTAKKMGTDIPDPLVKGNPMANFLRSKLRVGRQSAAKSLAVQGRANAKQYYGGVKRPIGAPPQYGKVPYSRS